MTELQTVEAPQKRAASLDLYLGTQSVIGQERARKQLAVLLERQISVKHGRFPRSNGAVIAGWTGTGKTYLTRMMCQLSGLAFAEANATQYTESGYAGEDLSQMFLPLLEAAARMYDANRPTPKRPTKTMASVLKRPASQLKEIVKIAETGVVLLDEFDKWMHRINHVTGRLDTAVQAELLKMVEGSVVYISDNEDEIGVPFDTTRVLILCAGAFVGLARQVAKRLNLSADDWDKNETLWENIEPDDFVKYGVIPELAGRLSTHVFLRPLKPEHMVEIMAAPGGLVEEYRARFEAHGVEWRVPPEALTSLASRALQRDIGARGIEHCMWQCFGEALFQAATSEGASAVTLTVNDPKARVA